MFIWVSNIINKTKINLSWIVSTNRTLFSHIHFKVILFAFIDLHNISYIMQQQII